MPDKKVSKLISYFLRHAPQEAGLTLDAHGWTSVEPLLAALAARGILMSISDLQTITKSFDKVRWEFDESGTRIRATHGHSVAVEPDAANLATPPSRLYHGTPVRAFQQIIQEGLRPMSRQSVHLAADPPTALAVGARRGQAVLLEVDAETMTASGHTFHCTAEGVWLTAAVPLEYLSAAPWRRIDDPARAKALSAELRKELSPEHALYALQSDAEATWQHDSSDDVLFENRSTGECYVVHLTWKGKIEEDLRWPVFMRYGSLAEWITERVILDQKAYFS